MKMTDVLHARLLTRTVRLTRILRILNPHFVLERRYQSDGMETQTEFKCPVLSVKEYFLDKLQFQVEDALMQNFSFRVDTGTGICLSRCGRKDICRYVCLHARTSRKLSVRLDSRCHNIRQEVDFDVVFGPSRAEEQVRR